jgi:hypothetical protein
MTSKLRQISNFYLQSTSHSDVTVWHVMLFMGDHACLTLASIASVDSKNRLLEEALWRHRETNRCRDQVWLTHKPIVCIYGAEFPKILCTGIVAWQEWDATSRAANRQHNLQKLSAVGNNNSRRQVKIITVKYFSIPAKATVRSPGMQYVLATRQSRDGSPRYSGVPTARNSDDLQYPIKTERCVQ